MSNHGKKVLFYCKQSPINTVGGREAAGCSDDTGGGTTIAEG